jgi:hypothetical protein
MEFLPSPLSRPYATGKHPNARSGAECGFYPAEFIVTTTW